MLAALAFLATAPIAQADVALAGGEKKTQAVELRAGDALRGSVEQRGIDVVVTLRRPDGTVALEVDSPNGTDGPEPVAFVAPKAGTYVLEIGALEKTASPGRYDVTLDAPRPAVREDRDAAEALALHIDAFAARNEGLSLMGQAHFRRSAARYAAAERGALRALAFRERVLGRDHYDVASTHAVLGLVYDEVGDYAKGERHFARAFAILEARLGAGHPGLLTMQSDLGYLRMMTGEYESAVALFTRSLARREELYGADSDRMLAGLGGLAESYLKLGKLEQAEETARRVLAIRERAKQPSAHSQTALGTILLARGRSVDAEAACTAARTAIEAAGGSAKTGLASALLCLGRARLAAGDLAGAEPLLAEAVRVREAAYGPDHPTFAEALVARGELQAARKQAKAARETLGRALRIRERRLGPAHPLVAEVLAALQATGG